MFIDRLIKSIREKNSPVVAGLDPRLEYIPTFLKKNVFDMTGENAVGAGEVIYEFNRSIIDAIYDLIPAVKLQMAYYEMYGENGINAFVRTIEYARQKGLIVISDGKRNDIGTSAEAYSAAYLGITKINDNISIRAFDTDCITVNPYLGFDGIKPFITDCRNYNKGIFILVKTSNKSSGELQDLLTYDSKSIYEYMAGYIEKWGSDLLGTNGYSSIGAVVGATYPNQAKILRKIMRHAYILVPGYGAQGGTARDIAHNFNDDSLGAIVNASRSIIYAYMSDKWKYGEEKFFEASRQETEKMIIDINNAVLK